MLKADAPTKLMQARERAGLSRSALERLTKKNGFKVSEGTIFNIESGVSKKPYLRSIYALADALELDPQDLVVTEEVAS